MDGAAAADLLREQAVHCRGRSPLYARLLAGLAGATERSFDGGVVPRLLGSPGPSSPLEARLLVLAAIHHAALRDPSLAHAAWFPTAVDSPRPPDEGAPGALALAYLVEHEDEVAEFVATHRLQTNEIGRCTALLPGFLAAARFDLPLRLLEVGCAAGLNLRFDRYRYHYLGGPRWGPGSGPHLEANAEGGIPEALVPPSVEVAERRGVDLDPIDPISEDGALLLRSFVWPDEHDRHQRLEQALEVASITPAHLETGDLTAWASASLEPREGSVTVLFHSLVTYLLDADERAAFGGAAEAALRAARPDAPVVHVSLEPPQGLTGYPELVIATGAGEGPPDRRTVLTSDWHGRWVRWW